MRRFRKGQFLLQLFERLFRLVCIREPFHLEHVQCLAGVLVGHLYQALLLTARRNAHLHE